MNTTLGSLKDESFIHLFERVWYSLDDVLVCIGVWLVAVNLSRLCHNGMRSYFRSSVYVAQAVHFAVLFSCSIFLVGHLVGGSTAVSLFQGFSIGFGYAMQPYIVSLLAGATFLSMDVIGAGDELIVNSESATVKYVGLLYVSTQKGATVTYYPNSVLSSRPFSVQRKIAAL